MNLTVVILAAGQGTRMRSARPKVLHEVGGRPMVAHVLDAARSLSPQRMRLVVGHGAEEVRDRVGAPDVELVEQEEQLGTGHAVQCAGPEFADSDWVLVLNGDVPLLRGETLRAWADALASSSHDLGILTTHPADPTGYGRILRDDQGRVTGIREEKDATPEERSIGEVFTGTLAVRGKRLGPWLASLSADNAQGEYYLTDVVGLAAAAGGVLAHRVPDPGEVQGVNNRRHLAAVEAAFQERTADALMEAGVTLRDPARTAVYGKVHPATDVVVDPGCQFEGEVTLGAGAHIGPGCVLRDCAIGEGARVEANSHIEGTTVGPGAAVGPFARLRPGTVLEEGSKVGNFVEVKKARLGPGVKANHLSYVGDADVGAGANLGAGTITCNYDGHRKHTTTIGAGAFIGSAVQLVAPVSVGEGATIGAGSTITKDAPAGALTLSRAKQLTRHDWKRPEERAKEEQD
ncbi:bifunctional UDP-N-acetylglucosamine diphosphorylase/glucosamine-1-phosphate N-acetyltransferase GlmU [Thiohalorhabdus denitrificans]|uniref:Bifunctional protein GlmU n=1 Tax=Thiohalorhabdus denitrificans TaxID=381306 RepID=A0A1G5E9G6_9GAMM|nr:bifunctional UDP-N-acetylglucosamine diphosphorylase/glucosamine-1-phosphate N-acetyltransferase GlmU [Thiohalorhabdus denitrificans]SCY23360.1 UDP-N-acetylglucosamine pyrophosphorylase [Thiohalorhabdus denitrificans]